MPEEKKEKKIDPVKETPPPPPQTPPAQSAPPTPPPPPQNQGMSSGAKWGIGIGACFCCLIIVFIVFLILGFAGCSFIRGFGGYNWPAAPPLDNGTEIPVPSFSNTPTPSVNK
ncbi:MAG: hypothetical protein NT039_02950 [Candidatus Berkelbacteria bacterium]|nr:hypothetical protein [Candidatus Berkelbacteria bacterium]